MPRGGKRIGSGRKKTQIPMTAYKYVLPTEVVEWIRGQSGTAAAVITRAINYYRGEHDQSSGQTEIGSGKCECKLKRSGRQEP